jgi:hypothetical protein
MFSISPLDNNKLIFKASFNNKANSFPHDSKAPAYHFLFKDLVVLIILEKFERAYFLTFYIKALKSVVGVIP